VRKDHREAMNLCGQIVEIDPNYEGVAQKMEYESMLCKDVQAYGNMIAENLDKLRGILFFFFFFFLVLIYVIYFYLLQKVLH